MKASHPKFISKSFLGIVALVTATIGCDPAPVVLPANGLAKIKAGKIPAGKFPTKPSDSSPPPAKP